MKTWRVTASIAATVELDVEAETQAEAEGWVEEYMEILPMLDENFLEVDVMDSVEVKE